MRFLFVFIFISSFSFAAIYDNICKVTLTKTFKGNVSRVVDGDTVYVNNAGKEYKIRMLGIDAAETHYNGQSQGYWGETAALYLASLLPVGTPVVVAYDVEEFDYYKRILGHIYKSDYNINYAMLRYGYAVVYQIYPNMKYLSCYSTATIQAKQENNGIFSVYNPLTELPFEFRDRISHSVQDKWVGDITTNEYVSPKYYKEIPVEYRVFFFTKADAEEAGYLFVK